MSLSFFVLAFAEQGLNNLELLHKLRQVVTQLIYRIVEFECVKRIGESFEDHGYLSFPIYLNPYYF